MEREKILGEIEAFRKEETNKLNKQIDEIKNTNSMDEALAKSHKEKLESIELDYKTNKQKAIDYLVNALMEVDLSVPDVVIGRFSHKLLVNQIKK